MLSPLASNPFDDERSLNVLRGLPSFEEALARLLFLVEYRRPCGVVLGLPGTGKSALIQVVRTELSTASCTPISIDLRTISPSGIPWTLATGMGLSPAVNERTETLWRMIEDRMEGAASAGLSYVPLFDHVDHADHDTLKDINCCCHLTARSGSTVLLSARPPLLSDLSGMVRSLCDLRIELPLWTADETMRFVTQTQEATNRQRFTESAITAIQTCSGGRLRDVLQVCRLAVFAAQAQGIDIIDAELLETIAGEIWRSTTHRQDDTPAEPTHSEPSTATVKSTSVLASSEQEAFSNR